MDENDIYNMNHGDNRDDGTSNKMSFEKKYLIGVTIVAVVLIIAMTIAGIFIGYNAANKKVENNLIETNPNITINGTNGAIGVQDIAAIVENSVVQVTSEARNPYGVTISRGSGVIVTDSGYIITNAHVIANALSESDITVTLANGNEYTARDFKIDVLSDIAYIKIETMEKLDQAVFGDSDTLKKGEPVIAIGNPLGTLGGSVTDGILSALDRDIIIDNRPMRLLQTNAEISPGNSGGGLFNMKGELIGIVNAKGQATGVEGIGFAIPINIAKDVFEDLFNYGYVKGRIDTGILPINIQSRRDMITAFGGIVGDGEVPAVYVYGVDRKLADKIAIGDKIVAINDQVINNLAEYNIELCKYNIGDEIKLTIKRNGHLGDVKVKLNEYTGQ